jgi:hypothetical protein
VRARGGFLIAVPTKFSPGVFGEETPQKQLDLTSFKEYLKYFGVRV